ncbi:hypothetical protein PILCRDRAFT_819627, partial [Piloderma croceum F 1598]
MRTLTVITGLRPARTVWPSVMLGSSDRKATLTFCLISVTNLLVCCELVAWRPIFLQGTQTRVVSDTTNDVEEQRFIRPLQLPSSGGSRNDTVVVS